MRILRAIGDSISGTFADQWSEIITVDPFDELTVVSPGCLKKLIMEEAIIFVVQKTL